MDGRPAEYRFHHSFSAMYQYPLAGRYLVIYPSVAFQVNKTVVGYIIYKPAYFVGMRFYYYFKLFIRVNDTYCSAVRVYEIGIYVRLYIFQPQLLPAAFKACGRSVIDIVFEKSEGTVF